MKHENALGLMLAHATHGHAASASPRAGTSFVYKNELGSTASFSLDGNNSLSGTYTSVVSGGGQPVSGPITGWVNGYAITWSVLWPTNPPTLTSWIGEFLTNGTIETLWYLVGQTATPGDPTQFWTAINAGTDTFTHA
jgi:hypothetical protein